jgi:hypothetical protein
LTNTGTPPNEGRKEGRKEDDEGRKTMKEGRKEGGEGKKVMKEERR